MLQVVVTPTEGIIAAVIGLVLFGVSLGYNWLIDTNPAKIDGQTAERVGWGVLYTLLGAALISATLFGWAAAGIILGVHLFAFIMAGLPMWYGDRNRSQRERTKE